VDAEPDDRWYAVRSVFQTPAEPDHVYEERVTLWRAESRDDARGRAEAEAAEYAEFAGAVHLSGFAQIYPLADAPPRDGTEVFSLVRDSPLPPNAYIDRFLANGHEREQ
jgi:hypothetical protein